MLAEIALLAKRGLITDEQCMIPPQPGMGVCLKGDEYHLHYSSATGWCQLQKQNTNLYLVYTDGILDLVPKQQSSHFKIASSFIAILDTICASFLPAHHPHVLVCECEGTLQVKKHIVCLHHETVTIFHIVAIQDDKDAKNSKDNKDANATKDANAESTKATKDQRRLSDINFTPAFQWLDIVTPTQNGIPAHLHIRMKQHPLLPSLGVLVYIVQCYDTLPPSLLCIGSYSGDLEAFIMRAPRSQSYAETDTRINLAETQIRHLRSENATITWSPWYPIPKKKRTISQVTFWSHIVRIAPPRNYLEYSSNNTRLVRREDILRYSKDFYHNILNRYYAQADPVDYLDRMWDLLFQVGYRDMPAESS